MGRLLLSIVACIRNTTFINSVVALAIYFCVAVAAEFSFAAAYNSRPEFKFVLMYYLILIGLHVTLKIKYWYNKIQ